MRAISVGLGLCLVFSLGCGGAGEAPNYVTSARQAKDKDGPAFLRDPELLRPAQAPAPAKPPQAEVAAQEVARKIIYTANLDLIVDDLDAATRELEKAVEEVKGYVARSEVRGTPGSPRQGTWTIRVPVAKFDSLREALSRLGELRRNSVDSEDITDRYYDMQARLKTNQAEEEGLRELLKKSAKTEDVLAVRKELNAVRGTIEEQQGKIQRWDKETQLATINVSMLDRKDYTPPVVPNFGSSIGRTFQASVQAMVEFGKGIVLVVTALVPWLLVLAVIGIPSWWRWRRRK